jgi:hypothetical protein
MYLFIGVISFNVLAWIACDIIEYSLTRKD